MKTCSTCKQSKPLSDFHKCGGGRTRGECKHCRQKKRTNHDAIKKKAKKQELLNSGIKICPMCGLKKPLTMFHKNSLRADGVQTYCKECYSNKNYKDSKIAENNKLLEKGLKRCTRCGNILDLNRFFSTGGRVKQPCISCTKIISKKYRASKAYEKNKKNRIKSQQKKRVSPVPQKSSLIEKVPATDKPKIKSGFLSVECKNCKKRMFPNYQQVMNRIRSFSGEHHGEMNFYCSDRCKQECPVFHFNTRLQIDPRSKLYTPPTIAQKARSAQTNDLKKEQCREYGYNYCERCGDIINVDLHHTLPISKHGENATDPDSHVLFCPGCHVSLHKECF